MAPILHCDCLAVKGPFKYSGVSPGITEIVFGAGPESGWHFFAIYEEFFVAFPPPGSVRVPDMEHGPHISPASLGLEQGPVRPAIFGKLPGVTMPLAVKMTQPGKRPVQSGVTNGDRDLPIHPAVIHQFDDSPLPEWHVPVGANPVSRHASRQADEKISSGRCSKEITQRTPDCR